MRYKFISSMLMLMLFIILFVPAATDGAAAGLLLWYKNVLPVLFPTTLIIQTMLALNTLTMLQQKIKLVPLCIVIGFISGYPMGAVIVTDLLNKQKISKADAQILIGVCNISNPIYVQHYLLGRILHLQTSQWTFMLLFYLIPVVWFLVRKYWLRTELSDFREQGITALQINQPVNFESIILQSSELMLRIGILMMLFTMLNAVIQQIPFLTTLQTAFIGSLLEISSGANLLAACPFPLKIKTASVLGTAAFGGFCITCQTYSIIQKQKLSLVTYICDKALIGLLLAGIIYLFS